MPTYIKKEEIEKYINYEIKPTKWHQVTQAQIDQFADCTLDHQFIHVDPEQAKQTMYGTTIAHGFLSLSMLSHFAEEFSLLIEGFYMGLNAGFDKVRFIHPVKVNSKVRACAKVLKIEESKPGQFRFITEITIEIENEEKPALIAEWVSVQIVK